MEDHSKPVQSFLQIKNNHLKKILDKIALLQHLNQQLSNWIEESISKYCKICNIEDKRIVFIAANGSVATLIRYQTSDILKKIQTEPGLAHIEIIECKVRSHVHVSARKKTKEHTMQKLSRTSAQIVKDTAEGILDPKLREIMLRIAKHIK